MPTGFTHVSSSLPPAPITRLHPALAFDPRTFVTATIAWLTDHWLNLLVAGAIATAIYLVLGLVKHIVARRLAERATGFGFRDIVARVIVRTGHFFRIMLAVDLVLGIADAPVPLAALIRMLFTIAAIWQVAVWIRALVLGLIERRAGIGDNHDTLDNAMALIRVLVTVVVFAIAIVVILDNLGFNVTGLIAGLGIGGIAIGLAAQGIFADLFAALAILFDKPFVRGESISFGTTSATVERVGMKSTRLRAPSGELIVISNTNLLSKEITNYSRLDRRRTTFTLGLVCQVPPPVLSAFPAMMKDVVEGCGATFVRCGFKDFGASSLDFDLQFDTMSAAYDDLYQMRHRVGLAINARLAAEHIGLAYPTTVNVTAAPDGTAIMPYPTGRAAGATQPDSQRATTA